MVGKCCVSDLQMHCWRANLRVLELMIASAQRKLWAFTQNSPSELAQWACCQVLAAPL